MPFWCARNGRRATGDKSWRAHARAHSLQNALLIGEPCGVAYTIGIARRSCHPRKIPLALADLRKHSQHTAVIQSHTRTYYARRRACVSPINMT